MSCSDRESKNIKVVGQIFGTSYGIIYYGVDNYERKFDSLFYLINKSMSTYISNSDISKLNRNESFRVDTHFINVFEASKEIFKTTKGMFDPTIGAVVNAWDFGPEGNIVQIDSLKIDSLMMSVGLNKVTLEDTMVKKKNKHTYLDFNAIAKGYAVDVIAQFLDSMDITDYLVEIGGEIRCKGINRINHKSWSVGIDWPNFDGSQAVLKTISLENTSMATSGTYRKFKIDSDGNRYAHIIDATTGYPSKTNILSVSVLATNCMIADAYATSFQAMGIESVKKFLKTHPELKVFFVFDNEKNELETLSLNDFPE